MADGRKLGLAATTAIGIGGMIGGGIFAVLGLAISTAGHAVALTLVGGGIIALLTGALSTLALAAFLAVNLFGARLSGGVELGVVAVKLSILVFFAAVAAFGVRTSHFVPVFDKGAVQPIAAIALIFVAYEGFELIPNGIAEMVEPERNLRRAIVGAILITMVVYVVVAVVTLGNLSPEQISRD